MFIGWFIGLNSDLTNKVNVSAFNQLPVKPDSGAFYWDGGINVVNKANTGYTDVSAKNYYIRGDHILCNSRVAFTNTSATGYQSIDISDIMFSGSTSAWQLINRLSFAGTASSCYSLTGKINGQNGQIWGVSTSDDYGFEVGVRWNEVSTLYFRQKLAGSWNAWYKVSGTIA